MLLIEGFVWTFFDAEMIMISKVDKLFVEALGTKLLLG